VLLPAGLLLVVVAGAVLMRRGGDRGPALGDLPQSPAAVQRAIDAARDRVEEQPESAEGWGHLGMVLLAHDIHGPAERCFARAEELDSREYLWPYLAGVSRSVRDPDGALPLLRRAVERAPERTFARLRLAEQLLDRGELTDAEQEISAALELAPDDPRAALAQARWLHARGEFAAALPWAERSRQAAPQQRATLELLAQLYYRSGQSSAAEEAVSASERVPDGRTNWDDPAVAQVLSLRRDPDWQALRAQSLFAAGERAAAVALLEAVVRDHPEKPGYAVDLGRMWELAGDHGRAAAVLDDGLSRHPHDCELHRLRGVVHISQRELDEARRRLERATQLKPDYALAWENLGECLRQSQETDAALAALTTAVRLGPQSASAHALLGRALLDAGRAPEAVAPLEAAVRLAPEQAQWRDWLDLARGR
jgi:tetratricopeptide (TPR) repeat protein